MQKRIFNSLQLISTQQRQFSDSNVLKGQHVRYIPKKLLKFHYDSPEGPLSLIFHGSDSYYKRLQNWKISALITIPGFSLAYYSLGMSQPWVYPMLLLPTAYQFYDYLFHRFIQFRSEIYRIYLLKNGDQFICETYDGMLHRMNIIDNDEHTIVESGDHIVFVFNNGGRTYIAANKNAQVIDYDVLDRVLKGVCVETQKFQKLYNRLLYRQTPKNLRPAKFDKYIPQENNFNSNKAIWKILNRTIYREEDNGAWLRRQFSQNQLEKMSPQEKQIITKLQSEYNIKYIYPEDLFYKTHKISRKDFLTQLEEAKTQGEKDQIILKLFEDPHQNGRRGVLSLKEAIEVIKEKIEDKQRMFKFAQKFGKDSGILGDQDEKVAPGINLASIRDLV